MGRRRGRRRGLLHGRISRLVRLTERHIRWRLGGHARVRHLLVRVGTQIACGAQPMRERA